jgi:predicted site-specific integrase-resolvase
MSRKPQLYSLGEARKLLARRGVAVSYRSLRRWIEQGKLNAHHCPHRPKQAGQWLLDEDTVEALARSRRDNRR